MVKFRQTVKIALPEIYTSTDKSG